MLIIHKNTITTFFLYCSIRKSRHVFLITGDTALFNSHWFSIHCILYHIYIQASTQASHPYFRLLVELKRSFYNVSNAVATRWYDRAACLPYFFIIKLISGSKSMSWWITFKVDKKMLHLDLLSRKKFCTLWEVQSTDMPSCQFSVFSWSSQYMVTKIDRGIKPQPFLPYAGPLWQAMLVPKLPNCWPWLGKIYITVQLCKIYIIVQLIPIHNPAFLLFSYVSVSNEHFILQNPLWSSLENPTQDNLYQRGPKRQDGNSLSCLLAHAHKKSKVARWQP